MTWDLGPAGLATLAGMALGFGIFTQVVFLGRGRRWLWLVAAVLIFGAGIAISEVWFGWATGDELQPNIDGLSFDEVLLGYAVGVPAVLIARYLDGRRAAPGAAS